jgi:hypothetical protein
MADKKALFLDLLETFWVRKIKFCFKQTYPVILDRGAVQYVRKKAPESTV